MSNAPSHIYIKKETVNFEGLLSFSPDWRPEELLRFPTPRNSEAVSCVQQQHHCQHRQGDRGIVKGYEDNWKTAG